MTTMTAPRPDWRTIRGGPLVAYKSATAAHDSICPDCGAEVARHEPIYLVGVSLVEGPRPRRVDLTSAEWVCGVCLNWKP